MTYDEQMAEKITDLMFDETGKQTWNEFKYENKEALKLIIQQIREDQKKACAKIFSNIKCNKPCDEKYTIYDAIMSAEPEAKQ